MTRENVLNLNFKNTYKKMSGQLSRSVDPTPVEQPELLLYNHSLASELGLTLDPDPEKAAQVLSGSWLLEDSKPIAQAYAGHQFGHFNILGDGRTILLGEHEHGTLYDVQLKGSGPTPYSRLGDGRATLSSMLREYLISEAMHGLNIPTTRSLSVVTTGENVQRETSNLGAVLTRISKGHIRVGTFQYAATLGNSTVDKLVHYTVDRFYPHLKESDNIYLALLNQVINVQASLVSKWQLVGFVHGVLNTDNVSIAGESIDFGPCAFMDTHHPKTVFSSIDQHRRYAYGQQPMMTQWNLARFAETLLPFLDSDEKKAIKMAESTLMAYTDQYNANWQLGMSNKLGFPNTIDDSDFLKELTRIMSQHQLDHTNTFVNLMNPDFLSPHTAFNDWIIKWHELLTLHEISFSDALLLMNENNPTIIPRNHQVEKVLDQAKQGDLKPFNDFVNLLRTPYVEQKNLSYTLPSESTNSAYKTYCGT